MNEFSSSKAEKSDLKKRPKPDRCLIKISGEGFSGDHSLGKKPLKYLGDQLVEAKEASGAEIAVVVGGGNILRGAEQGLMRRELADYTGMTATLINALAYKSCLEERGIPILIQSALSVEKIGNPIDHDKAINHIESGGVVIFACGTGNPYFTTDSAAALRAGEIGADVILKGTQVNGVYTSDPKRKKKAEFIEKLTYEDIFKKDLGIIDPSAAKICQQTDIPMVIFNLYKEGGLKSILLGEKEGTFVYSMLGN